MKKNADVARVLERIADLLEITGGDRFRVNSYRRAARSVEDMAEDVGTAADEGRLSDLPGIGKGTAGRIESYLKTGHIDVLDELEAKLPKELPDLLEISGLGPKKVALMHKELKVAGLADLKREIESGRLAELAGFGEQSVKKISEGIAFLERSGGRTPLGVALSVGEAMAERVRAIEGVRRVELAGSLRRGAETIGDIDLLCEADDGEKIIKEFTTGEGVQRVLAAGDTKGSITVALDDGRELQVDLRVVPGESFGAAWNYFTGSKAHNVHLRELAVRRSWRLNEYGLFDGKKQIAGKDEAGIYKMFDLPFVPPELREDRGEFEEGVEFDDLVSLDDIRGDLHMHTTASDGRNTIEEMAHAAKALGYTYIAICDHSKSSTIANGLSEPRMKDHIRAIRAADEKLKGITVLAGCECDILPDGSLDYPDELLAACDWVVASIHSAMGSGGGKKLGSTERTLAAIENRYVCAIGHPTGRLLQRREAMELDIGAVARAAAENGTLLEVNASWQRLDLKDLHVRQVLDAGTKIVINTDAHHTESLAQMRLGVLTARRGGARKHDVANTATVAGLKKLIAAKRGRK